MPATFWGFSFSSYGLARFAKVIDFEPCQTLRYQGEEGKHGEGGRRGLNEGLFNIFLVFYYGRGEKAIQV